MAVRAVQDAKARFSEMLDRCITEGMHIVTRRGEQAAVLVPIKEWQRLSQASQPTIHDVLPSDLGRGGQAFDFYFVGKWVPRGVVGCGAAHPTELKLQG